MFSFERVVFLFLHLREAKWDHWDDSIHVPQDHPPTGRTPNIAGLLPLVREIRIGTQKRPVAVSRYRFAGGSRVCLAFAGKHRFQTDFVGREGGGFDTVPGPAGGFTIN